MLVPYRRLRAHYEDELARVIASGRAPEPTAGASEHELGCSERLPRRLWLEHMIELERRIYGPLHANRRSFRHPFNIRSLQDGFDAERTGLYLIQLLYVAVIAALVTGLLLGE